MTIVTPTELIEIQLKGLCTTLTSPVTHTRFSLYSKFTVLCTIELALLCLKIVKEGLILTLLNVN